jgi:hypothetical protein
MAIVVIENFTQIMQSLAFQRPCNIRQRHASAIFVFPYQVASLLGSFLAGKEP